MKPDNALLLHTEAVAAEPLTREAGQQVDDLLRALTPADASHAHAAGRAKIDACAGVGIHMPEVVVDGIALQRGKPLNLGGERRQRENS